MRTTMYTSDESTYTQIAAIAQNGWLIVVPDENAVERMEILIQLFGGQAHGYLLQKDPEINAAWLRDNSVEVHTMAEIEQMDANEKLAMEVL